MKTAFRRAALGALRAAYSRSFGEPPEVGPFHPLWSDTNWVSRELADWKARNYKILWLTSRDSLFHRVLRDRLDTAALFLENAEASLFAGPYHACLCELVGDELVDVDRLYAKIRPLMYDGGRVVFLVTSRDRLIASSEVVVCQAMPDVDVSEIRFNGSAASERLRRLYLRVSTSIQNRPLLRALATATVLLALAPLVRAANALALRRDPKRFTPRWTSMVVTFVVRRGSAAARPAGCGQLVANTQTV